MTRTRLHYTEYQPTEPQFIEPLDTDEYEKETKELLSQVPSQHHEYLDIFRKKGGTETLPSPIPGETFDGHPQTSPNFNETNLVSTDESKRYRKLAQQER
jgi:hypothetical protein